LKPNQFPFLTIRVQFCLVKYLNPKPLKIITIKSKLKLYFKKKIKITFYLLKKPNFLMFLTANKINNKLFNKRHWTL
jgi:hypothetical protein